MTVADVTWSATARANLSILEPASAIFLAALITSEEFFRGPLPLGKLKEWERRKKGNVGGVAEAEDMQSFPIKLTTERVQQRLICCGRQEVYETLQSTNNTRFSQIVDSTNTVYLCP